MGWIPNCIFCNQNGVRTRATAFGAQSTDCGKTVTWAPICDGHANGWNEGGDWDAPIIQIKPEPEKPKDLDPDLQKAIDGCPDTEKLNDLVHDVKAFDAANIGNKGIEAQVRFLLEATITREDILKALKG